MKIIKKEDCYDKPEIFDNEKSKMARKVALWSDKIKRAKDLNDLTVILNTMQVDPPSIAQEMKVACVELSDFFKQKDLYDPDPIIRKGEN